MEIKNVIKQVIGKEPIYLDDYTDLWLQWYAGDVKAFHNYTIYNGKDEIRCKRRTLNMAKQVCEDWANLLLNEKTEVAMSTEEDQLKMNKLLEKLKFWTKGNKGIEETFALGQGAFVGSITEKGKPRLQFINRTKIFPISIDDDEITECAFVNITGSRAVLQIHYIENGEYIIRTLIGKKTQDNLTFNIGGFETGEDNIFYTGSSMPWFVFIKPNISNNIDINSPMGISIFANSLQKLEGVDLAYDGFCNEMQLGKARIFVDGKLVRYDADGEHKIFDNNDIAFYIYGNGEGENKKPLEFYSPELRVEAFFEGINKSLNLLSSAVGFGENKYKFDGNGVATATQVVSENSEMFRTLKKHEIILNEALVQLINMIIYICNNFGDGEYRFKENQNIEIHFDDSIIQDKDSEKMSDRQDVTMGVMGKAEYRSKWYSEDLETAQQKIAEIEENKPKLENFFSEE